MVIDDLIKLIRGVILNEKVEIEITDELENILKEQNISAFLYKAVGDDKYKSYYLASQFKNKLFDETISKLIDEFNQNNVGHVLMKGHYIKRFYNDPALRVMGDVDILVFNECLDKAHEIASKLGFKRKSIQDHHDVYFNGSLELEIHNKLFDKHSLIHGAALDDWQNHLISDGGCTYHFDDTYHFIFVLLHYIKHLRSGISVRPIIDLYILYTKTEVNKDVINEFVKEYSLEKFYDILLSAFNVFFGYAYVHNNKDIVYELIDYSISSCKNDKHKAERKTLLYVDSTNKNRFTFILSKLFPAKSMLAKHIPLAKYTALYPICWFINVFRLIFTRAWLAIALIKHKKIDIVRKVGIQE